jgi:hypothetical protein
MAQLHPGNRFLAVFAAQGLGVGLLFVIGLVFELFYKSAKPIGVAEGVEYIWFIAVLVLIVWVVGSLVGFIPARCKKVKEFEDAWVDWTVRTFLYCDILLLTILVCKQGGLSKSVFFPLFLMIPVAHRLVERDDKLDRVIWGAIVIGVAMVLCYFVSIGRLGGFSVTDYSTLTPKRFALALVIVALISLAIPIFQTKIIEKWPAAGT